MSNIKKPSLAVKAAVSRQWDETEAFLAECSNFLDVEQKAAYLATKPDPIWVCDLDLTPLWRLSSQGYADIGQLLEQQLRFLDCGELSQYGSPVGLKKLQPSGLLGCEFAVEPGERLAKVLPDLVDTLCSDGDEGVEAAMAEALRYLRRRLHLRTDGKFHIDRS